jgi:AraC-like DNA-binding protein
MHYRELTPAPQLQPFIRCYWLLDAEAPSADVAPERILPDGCVEIILNLADSFERHHADGAVERQPNALLIGPSTRHLAIKPTGTVSLVGIRFFPAGAAPFLSAPPGELRDAAPWLGDVATPLDQHLEERLADLDDAGRGVLLDAVLTRRLERSRRPLASAAVFAAVSAVLASAGRVRVDDLARRMGVGPRQLERRFAESAGYGPKTLCRLARFQSAVRTLDRRAAAGTGHSRTSGAPRWSAIAIRCGYADQAHLTREFREFAGTTPGGYVRERHPMSDKFVATLDLAEAGGR